MLVVSNQMKFRRTSILLVRGSMVLLIKSLYFYNPNSIWSTIQTHYEYMVGAISKERVEEDQGKYEYKE